MKQDHTKILTLKELFAMVDDIRKNPWDYRREPFQILDNIYYVGNAWVGAYLIDTGEGLILMDSNFDEVIWMLFENIRKVGFEPEDIKLLLLSHGHFDHIGGARYVQELSDCKIYFPKGDLFMLNERRDLLQGHVADFRIDDFYNYDETITLGNTTIQPLHTPGHTAGCTSFCFNSNYKGKEYRVASHGGLGKNGLSRKELQDSGLMVDLQKQYLESLEAMAGLPVDVFIPNHNSYFDIFSLADQNPGDHAAFIRPDAWRTVMQGRYRDFMTFLEQG